MSSITRDGVDSGAARAFERALIASARSDELPEARTEEAWTRLAAAVASLPAVSGRAPPESARRAEAVAAHAGAGAPTRWLLLGALGGGLVTAALLGWGERHRGWTRESGAVVEPPSLGAPTELPRSVAVEPSAPSTKRGPRSETSVPARAGSARRLTAKDADARRSAEPSTEHSTLAAEVAALDAARRAGSADETLRLVDRYQNDFPAGELAADAEVVAMEALAAKGDRDELTLRATRFLARYPNDPHAVEVRRLGGR